MADLDLDAIRERAAANCDICGGRCTDHAFVIHNDVPKLIAEVKRLREERTYLVGPEECMDMECEDYFDDDGNDLEGVTQCSHVMEKQVTADEFIAAMETQEHVRAYARRISHSGNTAYAKAGRELLALVDGGETGA